MTLIALIVETSAAAVIAPVAGVGLAGHMTAQRSAMRTAAHLPRRAWGVAWRSGALTLAFTAVCAAADVLVGSPAGAVGLTPAPLATLGASFFALCAMGTACGTVFADPLDAAGSALALSLCGAFGVLLLGPFVAHMPAVLVTAALAISPMTATASAAGIDLFRSERLYQLSPLAHTQLTYPAWTTAALVYMVVALACLAVAGRILEVEGLSGRDGPGRKDGPMKRTWLMALCLVVGVTAVTPLVAQNAGGARTSSPQGLSPDLRQKLTDSLGKGAAYLKQQQKPDGLWENHPGITAMAAAAMLRQPGVSKANQLAVAGKSLDALAKLAKPDGGIYDKDIPHYITAVSVMALVAGGRAQDQPLITKGRQYLADHLLDEGEGVAPSDKFYGGMGYGGTSDGGRADIISLEYGLRAMKEAELPANNAAWEKAIKFLQRTQNNSEANDQPWSANDGGFIYYPGYSQVANSTRSYGSATYAGIMSYSWANLKKTDPRAQSVMKWVRDNYTVDENPGLGQKTLYYYYMVFAKALQAIGEPVIVDAKGQRHNWRDDLGRKILSLQHPEGYWVNEDKAEMQDNKVLVTSFTMMALEATLQ